MIGSEEGREDEMRRDHTKYIVIGGGIAGMAAAEEIRREDVTAEITLFTGEPTLCPNRPMLIAEFAMDGSGATLFDSPGEWEQRFHIDLVTNACIEEIHCGKQTLHVAERGEFFYDRLIYAAGANALVPPVPGAGQEHVHVVRTRQDMNQIRHQMQYATHAVVIGGGMLGLEDAWQLHQEKLKVIMVEQADRILAGQMDRAGSDLMQRRVERMGVEVLTSCSVAEIRPHSVMLQDGRELPADLVLFSVGVRPNTALARKAGLRCCGNNQKWVQVDDHMCTSDEHIFAAGDAAAVYGHNDAIWDEAREMGRVAGVNAAGGDAVYQPVIPEHVFNGFDTEVFTMGDSSGAGTDGVFIRHADVEIFDFRRERYIRVSLQKDRIAGILLINASELVPELEKAFHQHAGEKVTREILQQWKESHQVDFAPADSIKMTHRGVPQKRPGRWMRQTK